MTNKPKQPTVPVVSHRIGDVKFPQDRHNIMYAVKKEIIRAAGRIRGNADKEATFRETLKILLLYADAKIEHDRDIRAAVVEDAVAKARAAEVESPVVKTEDKSEDKTLEADLGLEV